MESIGAYNDFIGMTHVLLEFVRTQNHVDQNGVGFVEIDDFHPAFGKRHRRVRQYVFDGRYHIANRLNLNGFYSQYIVCLVHAFVSEYKNRRTYFYIVF